MSVSQNCHYTTTAAKWRRNGGEIAALMRVQGHRTAIALAAKALAASVFKNQFLLDGCSN